MTIEAKKLHLIWRLIDVDNEAFLDKIERVLNSVPAHSIEENAWNELTAEQFLQGSLPEDDVYDTL